MKLPPGKYLAKHQPCGCIICTCKRLERERNRYKAKAEALLASADAISAAARDLRKFKKFPESVEALASKIILELHPFQA